MNELRILKIGGSVITDKREGAFEKLNESNLEEVCRAISEDWSGLIVVHGAGSFGHPHVRRYGLSSHGASKVHLACLRLSERFCSTLTEFDVPAMPIHPFCFFRKDTDLMCDLGHIRRALENNFLPVLHGDVIIGADGVEVLSGDDIVVYLAEKLNVKRVGFATDVDGVIFGGKVIKRLRLGDIERIREEGGRREDVTGGMIKKVKRVFEMKNKKVYIFRGCYENIRTFLDGGDIGTEVIV
ncbi:isopentenyl phosphate kinase [Archaeoglobus neptunius]|uniref:isopentenyl phosphate kinase n=1 Tax=Archaeoglobus neptunius TaxID=2798580 RepID=UPI001E3520A6|nr:isopentenyl phosphate kinase [Archaeoglobus neptunius]